MYKSNRQSKEESKSPNSMVVEGVVELDTLQHELRGKKRKLLSSL